LDIINPEYDTSPPKPGELPFLLIAAVTELEDLLLAFGSNALTEELEEALSEMDVPMLRWLLAVTAQVPREMRQFFRKKREVAMKSKNVLFFRRDKNL